MTARIAARAVPLILGMASLLLGIWTGLIRLGWPLLPPYPDQPASHGPLMVCGFLGTVICLERAVGLGKGWAYLAPYLSAAGAAGLLLGLPGPTAPFLLLLGSLLLVAACGVVVRMQPALHNVVMGAGAIAWLAGNVLLVAGRPLPDIVLLWVTFLVLTIAGERLELTRLLRPDPGARALFVIAAGILAAGALRFPSARLGGLGCLALALWLLRHDVARRTVRQGGLPRFVAICLLTGYVWLAVGGGLLLWHGRLASGPLYDASLHALFLGFVFAMIFGHAPIVFPAILGRPMPFRRAFYLHVALLQLSLLVRVGAGIAEWGAGRMWGGVLNAAALLLFLVNNAAALRAGARGGAQAGGA